MRVLYWTPLFWPNIGGIEVLAMRTLSALRERGHQFIVVTTGGNAPFDDDPHFEGVPVHEFPFWQALAGNDVRRVVDLQREVARVKREFRPDLVHLHFPGYPAFFHETTARAWSAPTLLTLHTDFSSLPTGVDTVIGRSLRSADWVAGVSHALLNAARAAVPEIEERSSVIYNGYQAPPLEPTPLPWAPPHILCVGRLVPEKGFDIALEALALLLRAFPDVRLTIAGEGPSRTDLEERTQALGLTNAVTFAGRVHPDRMPELMNQSTLVMIPSRYPEPFALVAVEAAHMARPVVATRMGGLVESVADRVSGILCAPDDAAAMAAAVAELLGDRKSAARMGRAGEVRAATTFGLNRYVDAYDALYRDVAARGRNGS